jgi:hypothetical protein
MATAGNLMGAAARQGLGRARMRLGATLVALVLVPLLALGLGPATPASAQGARLAGHDVAGLLAGGPDRPLTATAPAAGLFQLPDFGPVMGYTPAAARLAGV